MVPAWLPALYRAGQTRAKKSVEALTAWGIDLDTGNLSPADIKARLNGYAFAAHTTWQSRPGALRWRVCGPLAQHVAATKARAIFDHFQQLFGGVLDEACKDPSRLYYAPACPPAMAEHYQVFSGEGEYFDAAGLPNTPLEPDPDPSIELVPTIPQRVSAFAERSAVLRKRLNGDTSGLKDTSRSGLDYALASLLMRARFYDDEIAATLRGYGHGKAHTRGEEYLKAILSKLRSEMPVESSSARFAPQYTEIADLMAKEQPPLRMLVPKILPEGLTVLAGRPKVRKSWLALNIALALSSGGRALGREPVEQCRVLMVALEDGERRLQRRIIKIDAGSPNPNGSHRSLTFATDWERGNVSAFEEYLDEHTDTGLIIIDTYGKWKPPANKGALSYDEEVVLMTMLHNVVRQRQLGLLILHHTRKSKAEDVFDTVLGSTGIAGGPDTIWVLQRSRGDDQAELHVTGRDIEEEDVLALEWDHRLVSWKLVGKAERVNASEPRQAVMQLLSEHPEGLRAIEITATLGRKLPATLELLGNMCHAELITLREGRYYLIESSDM